MVRLAKVNNDKTTIKKGFEVKTSYEIKPETKNIEKALEKKIDDNHECKNIDFASEQTTQVALDVEYSKQPVVKKNRGRGF